MCQCKNAKARKHFQALIDKGYTFEQIKMMVATSYEFQRGKSDMKGGK